MLSNKWMVLCLLVGSVLSVAMLSSIPIYTNGVIQRMLTKDLERFQMETSEFPGGFYIRADLQLAYIPTETVDAYKYFNEIVTNEKAKQYNLPVLASFENISSRSFIMELEVNDIDDRTWRTTKVQSVSGIQDHLELVTGRFPSNKKKDGVYEVMVTSDTMANMNLLLDRVYRLHFKSDIDNDFEDEEVSVRVKVVGVVTQKDTRDPYWLHGLADYSDTLLMDYDLFLGSFLEEVPIVQNVRWYYAYDYHKINLHNLPHIINAYDSQMRWTRQHSGVLEVKFAPYETLMNHYDREGKLRTTLWVLQTPVLMMLAFYIFMVAGLVVEFESNEIAVLKSRGASSGQIFLMYLQESAILGLIALAVGPLLGLLICNILGSSNGFLEFVNRTALPISLSFDAIIYSVIAVVFFMLMMLLPAIRASRTTIVQYKQSKARGKKFVFWKRYLLDFILLGISLYGLYQYYTNQQGLIKATGLEGAGIPTDKLLFLISTLFILGVGLFFLRIYPYIIRLIFWIGRRFWSPVFYISFIQVGRTGGQEQFLMLFLILTLSIGLFSANSARTTNRNMEEKLRYAIGADIVVQEHWKSVPLNTGSAVYLEESGGTFPVIQTGPRLYIEPNFDRFKELKGVELATKVMTPEGGSVSLGGEFVENVKIQAIIPHEYAKVAWFRTDLMPYHWYHALKYLNTYPDGLLLSKSFQTEYNVQRGDSVQVRWGDSSYIEGRVIDFIEYWPTLNPNKTPDGEIPFFVVCNYNYVRDQTTVEPYSVWLKKKKGATSKEIYDDIVAKGIVIETEDDIKDVDQLIIQEKNDPMLQGTNGSLTLNFIVTMLISMIGFLIYWIMSIKSRVLQFGILRAMGLSLKKVIGMLVCEQVLISGTAIAAGIIIGGYSSKIFVPLLQVTESAASQVPPFKVITDIADYMKVYAIVAIMLIIGFIALGSIISRVKISQALKLGED